MQNHFIESNGLKQHYLEFYAGPDKPHLIMVHGITANAHAFDGVIHAGLLGQYNIYCPDLRGRGLSAKPAFAYSLQDHAMDILGLLDHLGIEEANIAGHSYGGLLSAYLCANYPDRIRKIVFIDSAAELNPNSGAMLAPVFERLSKVYDSYDAFIDSMKSAPQITFWDDFMESYYCADIQMRADGRVDTIPNLANMTSVALNVINQNWKSTFEKIMIPCVLINGTDDYNLDEPLLPRYKAKETVAIMKDCTLYSVKGNHQTMLYGANARDIAHIISDFIQ
ncbi:3-oxoadipate enol-lactonase 2 [compost metagenome]